MMINGGQCCSRDKRSTRTWASMSCNFKSNSIKSARFAASQAKAASPEPAPAIMKPSRCSALETRRTKPSSSSTTRMIVCRSPAPIGLVTHWVFRFRLQPSHRSGASLFATDFRNLHKGNVQTQTFDRFGKFIVVHGLDDVAGATNRVTTFDFARVVRSRQHQDRNSAQLRIFLKL